MGPNSGPQTLLWGSEARWDPDVRRGGVGSRGLGLWKFPSMVYLEGKVWQSLLRLLRQTRPL